MLKFVCLVYILLSVAVFPCQSHRLRGDPGFGDYEHVIIIGCDGFGGLYMENATSFLPTFAWLFQQGSTTTRARNQMPAVSAPNWCTTLTGMNPEDSGVNSNDWLPAWANPNSTVGTVPPVSGVGSIPQTIFQVLKEQSPRSTTAVSTAWQWITYLCSDSVDHFFWGQENDDAVTDTMIGYITQNKPTLMFVHLDDIDETGHHMGWGSPQYYEATKHVDARIAKMLGALTQAGMTDSTLVIVTADHGGYRTSHGDFNEANIFIPVLFTGWSVNQGYNMSANVLVTNKDIASTALYALGLQPGNYMGGRILYEIFHR